MDGILNLLQKKSISEKIRETVGKALLEVKAERKQNVTDDYADGWDDATEAVIRAAERKTGIQLR